MCLKDDIKFAQNSMSLTLSNINDENPDTHHVDSSDFTITLPHHPNPKNYKQALVQVQSLHCPPLAVNPVNHHVNDSKSNVFGVCIDGLGVMNSYISGIPSNIVGVGSALAAPLNTYSGKTTPIKDPVHERQVLVTEYDVTGPKIPADIEHGVVKKNAVSRSLSQIIVISSTGTRNLGKIAGFYIVPGATNRQHVGNDGATGMHNLVCGFSDTALHHKSAGNEAVTSTTGTGLCFQLTLESIAQFMKSRAPYKSPNPKPNFTVNGLSVTEGGKDCTIGDTLTYDLTKVFILGTTTDSPLDTLIESVPSNRELGAINDNHYISFNIATGGIHDHEIKPGTAGPDVHHENDSQRWCDARKRGRLV